MNQLLYKASTVNRLKANLRRAHRLLNERCGELAVCRRQRLALAKLASKTPKFDSPMEAWAAEKLRDNTLRGEAKP